MNDPAQTNINASPTDLAIAIFGSGSVTLSGFDNEPMPPNWLRPDVIHVPADITAEDLTYQVRKAHRLNIAMSALGWAMIGLALLLTCALLWVATKQAPPVATSQPTWYVVRVVPMGVEIKSDSGTFLTPIGSQLPNGARLQGVSVDRQAYSTDQATVLIQPKAHQATSP